MSVDYHDAVEAFFAPRPAGTALPAAVTTGSPARRLRDAAEPIAMHAVWSRGTNERLATLGLDFLTSYVGGRAASLGEPVGAVVASAFAWFEPGLVGSLYDGARSVIQRAELLQVRDEATVASLREVLAGQDPSPGVSVERLPRSDDLGCVGGDVEAAAIAGAGSGVSVLLVAVRGGGAGCQPGSGICRRRVNALARARARARAQGQC